IPQLLHLAVTDRYMSNDGLLDIGLPDTHGAGTVFRNPRRIDQPGMNGEGTGRGGKVAAVAAPVDKGAVDGYLTVEVVHIVLRLTAFGQDHALAGTRGRAPHAVDMRCVGIGTADHPHEQPVPGLARHLTGRGQVLQTEEHARAGTATHVGGGNSDVCGFGHHLLLGGTVVARAAFPHRTYCGAAVWRRVSGPLPFPG